MHILLLSLGLGALREATAITDGSKVGFIPTAGHPYSDPVFVDTDRRRLSMLGYSVLEIDPARDPRSSVDEMLIEADWIFVAGGNTFYLMQELRTSGVDEHLVELVQRGKPYVGASAGAAILGPSLEPILELDDRSAAPHLESLDGLGLVSAVVLSHFGKEKYREVYERAAETYGGRYEILFLRDDEALVFQNDTKTLSKVASPILLPDA